jgi:hypothetical protein
MAEIWNGRSSGKADVTAVMAICSVYVFMARYLATGTTLDFGIISEQIPDHGSEVHLASCPVDTALFIDKWG